MGQLSYNEAFDPRYAVAFVDTGVRSNIKPSNMDGNSFQNGLSTQIGVYGADGITINNNVMYNFVGPGKACDYVTCVDVQ